MSRLEQGDCGRWLLRCWLIVIEFQVSSVNLMTNALLVAGIECMPCRVARGLGSHLLAVEGF